MENGDATNSGAATSQPESPVQRPEDAEAKNAASQPKAQPVPRFMKDFLGNGEYIEMQTRQHFFEIADELIKGIAASIVLSAILWGTKKPDWLDNQFGSVLRWILVGFFALVAVRWLWRVLEWQRARLVVTNEKVLHVHGVLTRHVDSTPLVKVDEMTVEQPFFGRIFGFGRILVTDNAGGNQLLHGLRYIPKPAAVYRLITDSARRERAFEGGADTSRM